MYKSKKEKEMQNIGSTQLILKEIEEKCQNPSKNNNQTIKKQNEDFTNTIEKNECDKPKLHNGTKKLTIKLENSGSEKQKLYLKVESGNSTVNGYNFNIISDLLKDFFS